MRINDNKQLACFFYSRSSLSTGSTVEISVDAAITHLEGLGYEFYYQFCTRARKSGYPQPNWKVAGILIPDVISPSQLTALEQRGQLYVTLNGVCGPEGTAVQSDETQNMTLALEQLRQLGHRRIAYVSPDCNELDDSACAYLKDFGAATASNGAVGLYHIDGLTPEAKQQGKDLILPGAKEYVIDDAELRRVKENYPLVWKNPDAKPKLCFVGCPHLSLQQLKDWTDALEESLKASGRKKLAVPTVFTTAPGVKKAFEATGYAARFAATGAILSCICPLMYMNNPLCGPMPVITCSNKLRTYTTARYYTEAEILDIITKGAAGK